MKEYAYTYPDETPTNPTSTISYSYGSTNGWKDQLTGYNGQAITYDEIGNPLSYRGKALTWENGRQLAGVNSNISYTYTLDGTRLAKQVGNTKTEYTLDGNLVIRQKTGNEILNFYYDSAGKLLEIGYKANASAAETYYFVARNSQGDIVELYKSSDSTKVGSYSYDSWGKLLGATYATGVDVSSVYDILNKNPFRYRGYYYDTETGWYYLQSRYYDPEVKRFVNADDSSVLDFEQSKIGQFNLYSYCYNDPINMTDEGGHLPFLAATGILGAIVGAVVGGYKAIKEGKSVVAGMAGGAILGGAVGLGLGALGAGALAGSFVASTAQVGMGLATLGATVSSGGVAAGGSYLATNMTSAYINSLPAYSYPSQGSTGRSEPPNLTEQLAIEQAKSAPSVGTQVPITMTDPRWPSDAGWIKMQQTHQSYRYGQINIHYAYNSITGWTDDWKFK